MNLTEIRKNIDKIDTGILELLVERMKIMKEVLKYKQENNLPIFDVQREREVLDRIGRKAEKLNLSVEFVKSLYQEIMEEAKRIQKKFLE